MFKKILIANRGEIACRVAATAARMAIKTVAVYSDVDAHAKHVALCDEAVALGGSAPKDSYLRWEAILAAAKATGAQAVHHASSALVSRSCGRKLMPWYQYPNTSVAVSQGVPNHASREDTGIVLVGISMWIRVVSLAPPFCCCSQLKSEP